MPRDFLRSSRSSGSASSSDMSVCKRTSPKWKDDLYARRPRKSALDWKDCRQKLLASNRGMYEGSTSTHTSSNSTQLGQPLHRLQTVPIQKWSTTITSQQTLVCSNWGASILLRTGKGERRGGPVQHRYYCTSNQYIQVLHCRMSWRKNKNDGGTDTSQAADTSAMDRIGKALLPSLASGVMASID